MKLLANLVILLSLIMIPALPVVAQDYNNVFAAGASYDNISSPGISASLLEAKRITSAENPAPIYSFTLVDVSPVRNESTGKILWQTAITTGLAPLSRSLGPLGKLFIAGTIGGGVSGDSSGLAWSAGGAVSKTIHKSGIVLIADLRVLKVSNIGYQGRLGIKIGFGIK